MANTSRIKGFTVVGTLSGENRGKTSLYYVASAADEILVGDIVKMGTTSQNGVPTADLASAGDVPMGVVVAIINPKLDQDGKITTGSISLDLPTVTQIAASAAGYILVNDDPDVIMEVEASGTVAATDPGLNASHANAARTAATLTSPATIDLSTKATTATLNFQIMGFVRRVDNEVAASAKMLVRFNVHQFRSVGTTGV